MKKVWVICICGVVLSVLGSCGSSSSQLSNSPRTTEPSSTSASTSPTSETKSLVFAEDDNTQAIFHIGMTRDQVKQALTDNQMRLVPNKYGYSDEQVINALGFGIIGGLDISFGAKTGLLCEFIIFPASDTELSSPYATQKGLKIGDSVETVIKLYGEPLEKNNTGDIENEDLDVAYCYDLPIDLDDYYKESREIIGSGNTSGGSAKEGAHMVIRISQMTGPDFNKVDGIIYYADKAAD